MKALLLVILCHKLLAQTPPAGERHEFVISGLRIIKRSQARRRSGYSDAAGSAPKRDR
jgi:hypothetical protein